MINCTLNNYREWMGRYMDGSLPAEDMRSAEAFLELHPDILDEYLAELEELNFIPGEAEFTGKQNLIVSIKPTPSIDALNYQEAFISFYDNDSTAHQVNELNTFLSLNPALQKEFKAFGLSYVKPDLSVVYADKNELLKRSGTIVPLFAKISAAASILITIGIAFLFLRSGNNPLQHGTAMNETGRTYWPSTTYVHGSKQVTMDEDPVGHTVIKENIVSNHIKTNSLKKDLSSQKTTREFSESVNTQRLQTVFIQPENPEIAVKKVSELDHSNMTVFDPVAEDKPSKKGILKKIVSGEKIYIEDYVNATFSAFKDNEKEDNKWVLKVDRDKNGKSKKIKFSSPLFSIKMND